MVQVLVGIPAYNEEVAIGSTVLGARRHVDDVLVVDDGSVDRTQNIAKAAGARVIRHDANAGKGAAYATLWQAAVDGGYDALLVLDGDGQHDPDDIPALLARMEEGHDLVIGTRWGDKTQMPIWRKAGKRVLDVTTAAAAGRKNGTGARLTDSQSGFRAYSRRALLALQPRENGFSVESLLLIDAHDAGMAISEARIHCRYDVQNSTLGPVRHASGVLNEVLIQIGIRHPLLFIAMPGTVAFTLGGLAGLWSLMLYQANGIFAPGWVLLSMLLVTLGALTILTGMLFHLLPRSLAEATHGRKANYSGRQTKQGEGASRGSHGPEARPEKEPSASKRPIAALSKR